MEENKDLIPDAESENNQSQEVVADSATTDEVVINDEAQVKNSKKSKKDKKPMPKKKKIIIITACSILGVLILSFFIWLMVFLFGPSGTQSLSTVGLEIEMDGKWYRGTEGEFKYEQIFPNGTDFKVDGSTLTFKQDGRSVSRKIITVDGAVNVNNFTDLAANINAGKKVVVQNANLKAPKLEGLTEDKVPTMNVKNDVYGNGSVVNVYELVATRTKQLNKNGNKLAPTTNGMDYKKGTYFTGYSAFTIVPAENNAKVIFQDVHITGNDMSYEEGGDFANLKAEEATGEDAANEVATNMEARGVKLFSGYGSLLFLCGNDEAKTNALVKNCVIENGGKVVHINNSVVDIEGCIIRNAADTAISIATEVGHASTINMKNNVIVNSLTGGILFYCMDKGLTNANADTAWNTLNIDGFLDIYNWKKEKGLAFLPETEGTTLSNIANGIVNDEIPKSDYDDLKSNIAGEKYIHFAIIKIRTCDLGQGDNYEVKKNGSKVNGIEKVGFSDSKANGQENGFPVPKIASVVMLDIDVWGYYGNDKGAVKPSDNFDKINLNKLYTELREGR